MRSPLPLLLALCVALALPAALAFAEDARDPKRIKVIRRNNGNAEFRHSRIDERIDERRKDRVERREDWQAHWNEDDERRERTRLQAAREGLHGKACMYGRNGEVIHQPRGVSCDGDAPGPRPVKAAAE